jgi:hypothetical protein
MFFALDDTGATIINRLQKFLESPDYARSAEPCYTLKKKRRDKITSDIDR